MPTIELPIHGIVVEFDPQHPERSTIICNLSCYKTCPKCNQGDCLYQCDDSQMEPESEIQVAGRMQNNGVVDGILSVILGHAIAGIDITTPEYLEGVDAAFIQCDAQYFVYTEVLDWRTKNQHLLNDLANQGRQHDEHSSSS